jgi:hypothetical protein
MSLQQKKNLITREKGFVLLPPLAQTYASQAEQQNH